MINLAISWKDKTQTRRKAADWKCDGDKPSCKNWFKAFFINQMIYALFSRRSFKTKNKNAKHPQYELVDF